MFKKLYYFLKFIYASINTNKKSTMKCNYCKENFAKWFNERENDYICDACIPRGCHCRLTIVETSSTKSINKFNYSKQPDGKILPCKNWKRLE